MKKIDGSFYAKGVNRLVAVFSEESLKAGENEKSPAKVPVQFTGYPLLCETGVSLLRVIHVRYALACRSARQTEVCRTFASKLIRDLRLRPFDRDVYASHRNAARLGQPARKKK